MVFLLAIIRRKVGGKQIEESGLIGAFNFVLPFGDQFPLLVGRWQGVSAIPIDFTVPAGFHIKFQDHEAGKKLHVQRHQFGRGVSKGVHE